MKQKLAIHQLRTLSRKKNSFLKTDEHKLLTMQNSFLTPGVHVISVPNQEHGRSLLQIGLDSLGLYTDVGMLSMSIRGCPERYRDLYAELDLFDAFTQQEGTLEDYLLSAFTCDFLTIEYTQELLEQHWFGRFERLLSDYAISKTMPVVMFIYEENSLIQN